MTASFTIASSTGSYGVTLAGGLLDSPALRATLAQGKVVADDFFRARTLPGAPVWIEASEQEKSLDRAPALIERLRADGANRQTQLVAIGGGVIQDIAAFTASIYMRGVTWVYVPTTVLAMVDSCIGGKSSINVGPYKNLVGTFHPPQHIYIDPALAETLSRAQFASGLIEAAKICFCRGAASFATYLAAEPSAGMTTAALEEVIGASLQAKKWFIEIDEFDKKERLLLNFGHTFGHALEGASDYALPHGIAVGLGMLCANMFQRARGVDYAADGNVARLEQHLGGLIRTLPGLGDTLRAMAMPEVMGRFASDKKHTTEEFTVILIARLGAVVLEKIPRTQATVFALEQAIVATLESFCA